jgi:hypothetical protein
VKIKNATCVDSVDLNSVGSGVVGDPEVYFGRL